MTNTAIKSKKSLIIIGFGLAVAIGIIYVQSLRISKVNESAPTMEIANATFATRDISKGQKVTSDMVVSKKIDSKYFPGDGIWTSQIAIGKICKYNLKKGDLICTHHFGIGKFDKVLERKWPPGRDYDN